MTIRWLKRAMVDQFHLDTLQEQGGSYGYLNEGNLDAALARPENLAYYEGVSDLFELAACYCAGITQAQAYVDGNKRTALIATLVFVRLNGHKFKGDGVEAVRMMEAIASGTMPEAEVVTWLKTGCARGDEGGNGGGNNGSPRSDQISKALRNKDFNFFTSYHIRSTVRTVYAIAPG